MPFSPHVDFLTDFAQRHFTGDKSRDKMLQLKLDHSLRVFENAKAIIKGESIDSTTATLALLAALYHDIGRFPQFAEYGTFNDRISVNHGRLGALTLRQPLIPGNIPPKEMRLIRAAIGLHNSKVISDSLPEPLGTVTKVIRDADKLDILKVMVDHFSGEHSDPSITHNHKDIPDYYSHVMYDDVFAGRVADYNNICCLNDFRLLLVGWVFDLNFSTSIALISKRELTKNVFSFLPNDEKIQELENKVNKFMLYNTQTPS